MATRASRPPLTRERVLAAAVGLADSDGLNALTMRRLAGILDVEAMSLYHHLPAKEALLDGVAETVVAEICAAASGVGADDWRASLRGQFLAARQVMLRHPWAPGLLGTRRSIPMGLYAYYDRIVGTLTGAGFSHRLAHRALHAFGSLPLGFAQETFSPAASGGALEPESAEADLAAMAAVVPHLMAMMHAEMHAATDPVLGWCDSQTEFEFTVDLLLDGLDRLRSADG
ncbi:TetR/AcrR family transcriptional regulator C-terminal domain-containing protein [Paractinoplanes rishiriensis]|uniref:TetR family transcriptional regulator n=1 Tax=Paractinoplanes rishiriensis TaxID=1050105 RepID=A0A919K4L4_9ACTN|nr:TetR/AcrR family transcriptional regulator C-terminal domain-containing protein [Actinoplanes rishiriensis]GIF00711.1 TetR family transcriptional regulator [Actinoplanes rishiriensis]